MDRTFSVFQEDQALKDDEPRRLLQEPTSMFPDLSQALAMLLNGQTAQPTDSWDASPSIELDSRDRGAHAASIFVTFANKGRL
jgi:hypothetical protein